MCRFIIWVWMILFLFSSCKKEQAIEAAYDLIERVTPGYGE